MGKKLRLHCSVRTERNIANEMDVLEHNDNGSGYVFFASFAATFIPRALPLLFVVVFVPGLLLSQGRPGIIELRSANELKGRVINGAEVRELTGNVHFVQYLKDGGIVKVWSDRALQFIEAERTELYGRVKVVRDSLTITASEGIYFGKDRRMEMHKNVHLIRDSSDLTSENGEYYPDDKRAVFTTNVVVLDSASRLQSDRLVYWESEERSLATGHVKVVQFSDGTTVFGDTLINLDREKRSIVPSGARMIQIDTASSGEIDTLLVVSHRMESRNDSLRLVMAIDSVRMARTDLSARSQTATFYIGQDKAVLAGDPIVWHGDNQLTGDTIHIRLQNRKLNSVLVRGHAMAVSRADSIRRRRFDQMTGRRLTMSFADGKVRQIDVQGTATSLYYLYDDADPNGMNKSSGDRIIMDFSDGHIDRIKVIGGVQGEYYPEKMLLGREDDYDLDGFRWFPTRPKRAGDEMVEAKSQ